MSTTLEIITETGGKHLFGSMFGNGSVPVICAIVGLAIIAAIVIYIKKKKKGGKGENEDE